MTATPKLDNPLEGGSSPVPCSRAQRVWIEDREDGSLVAYPDYKAAFEAGDAIKIDGAYLAGGDMVFVQSGSLSMHIPQNGVVLILPNTLLYPT